MNTHNCPDCQCGVGESIPRPAVSSPGIRRLALQAAEQAVRDAREKRRKPKTETEETD